MNKLLLGACVAAFACGVANASTDLVTNGDFEAGTDNWTFDNIFATDSFPAHSGSTVAYTGCTTETALLYCSIKQDLATSAGAQYDLTFWVNNIVFGPGDGEQYRVSWGDQDLGVVDFTGTQWTKVSYTGLTATSGTTTLGIYGRNDPGVIMFDDVSVVRSSAPEPASWAMMLAGFGAIGGAMRSRRRAGVSLG